MADIHLLRDLQTIDTETIAKRRELSDVLNELKGSEELQAARIISTNSAETLTKAEAKQRDAELEMGSLKTKRNQSNDKLYSGSIKNPRELKDLQMEVESLDRRIALREETMIEILVGVETAQSAKDDADILLVELEEAWVQRLQELEKRKVELAIAIRDLQQRRKAQVARLPAATYKRYEKILVSNKGLAVVPLVRGNTCDGCSTSLPQSMLTKVRGGGIVNCPHCGRIIHT